MANQKRKGRLVGKNTTIDCSNKTEGKVKGRDKLRRRWHGSAAANAKHREAKGGIHKLPGRKATARKPKRNLSKDKGKLQSVRRKQDKGRKWRG